jgi:hypothetical protein
MRRSKRRLAIGLMFVLAGLYALLMATCSPVNVEFGHLASGVSIWQTGSFADYPVNPPLVKLAASAPAVALLERRDWRLCWLPLPHRSELIVGQQLAAAHSDRWFLFLLAGRAICALMSMTAIWVCWHWARELYGGAAAWVAAIALAVEPSFMAWSTFVSTDAPAAALGVLAVYWFWLWLRGPTWRRAALLGLFLGLALLTKFTWLVLAPLLPCLWLFWSFTNRNGGACGAPSLRVQCGQLAIALVLAAYLVNLGFGFDGSFQQLGTYRFHSRTLAGNEALVDGGNGGNRFFSSWIGAVPVPVPRDYLLGIDLQKIDFERNWGAISTASITKKAAGTTTSRRWPSRCHWGSGSWRSWWAAEARRRLGALCPRIFPPARLVHGRPQRPPGAPRGATRWC